jgi:predicted ATPase
MPLSLMSDGTLKWITLLTAALTASSVFSIEEPENYLHPNMQAQCVNILRDILFQENKHACILMTTHSETVLNNCKPSELIIVNLKDGQTIAYRCHNEAEISDEIAKTGFGLGYYYINNALQND